MAVSSLAELRKASQALQSKIVSGDVGSKGGGNRQDDPRFYYPHLDAQKNGYAVIRFLPATQGADTPWVVLHSHAFKHEGQWFIDNCPTTIGGDCPVCSDNKTLWNSEIESNKKVARDRKRKTTYYFNVLVREDPKNPENVGQVRIFKCGPKIFSMIMDAAKPGAFPDTKPVDAFDPWDGSDFKLKIRQYEGNVNYDKCDFTGPVPLAKTDEEIEAIWKRQHDLSEFVAKGQFKTFETLEERFKKITGKIAAQQRSMPSEQPRQEKTAEAPQQRTAAPESAPAADPESDIEYFAGLAKD
jgi:hypothetical protein